ncbi:MAG: hypothetical protein OXL34_04460 [Gemmatimonadota bacterium]|nr:hypothetical protein [Gemmatimonadota bacterium]
MPGLLVATTAFRDAAAFQIPSLGIDPAIVWVPHPVQNRTPGELERMAADALEPVLTALMS